jgi:hypothetical protein
MTDDHGRRAAADSHDLIQVRGARENNLADISLDIPKRRLTVSPASPGRGSRRWCSAPSPPSPSG